MYFSTPATFTSFNWVITWIIRAGREHKRLSKLNLRFESHYLLKVKFFYLLIPGSCCGGSCYVLSANMGKWLRKICSVCHPSPQKSCLYPSPTQRKILQWDSQTNSGFPCPHLFSNALNTRMSKFFPLILIEVYNSYTVNGTDFKFPISLP